MIYKVFDKKPSGGAVMRVNKPPIKSEIRQNQRPSDLPRVAKVSERTQKLAEELHKALIRKFESILII